MTHKILYIEDDPEQLELVRMFVSRDGFYLLTAKDGTSGLEMAQREFPMLVLIDINLPGMNGVELAEYLRADADTASIPLIALTSNTKHGVLQGDHNDLFDAFLTKPIMRKDLITQIAQFIALPS